VINAESGKQIHNEQDAISENTPAEFADIHEEKDKCVIILKISWWNCDCKQATPVLLVIEDSTC